MNTESGVAHVDSPVERRPHEAKLDAPLDVVLKINPKVNRFLNILQRNSQLQVELCTYIYMKGSYTKGTRAHMEKELIRGGT